MRIADQRESLVHALELVDLAAPLQRIEPVKSLDSRGMANRNLSLLSAKKPKPTPKEVRTLADPQYGAERWGKTRRRELAFCLEFPYTPPLKKSGQQA